MDGTAVNFNSMKLFGCKLGHSLEEINGGFTHDGYIYKHYFIPDRPHMLNLACNALGERGNFLDSKEQIYYMKNKCNSVQNLVTLFMEKKSNIFSIE